MKERKPRTKKQNPFFESKYCWYFDGYTNDGYAITECFNQIRTTIKEVYEKLEPILTPLWIIFKQVTNESLTYALEIIIQTFTSIADTIQ